jgi:hypothetical protein
MNTQGGGGADNFEQLCCHIYLLNRIKFCVYVIGKDGNQLKTEICLNIFKTAFQNTIHNKLSLSCYK